MLLHRLGHPNATLGVSHIITRNQQESKTIFFSTCWFNFFFKYDVLIVLNKNRFFVKARKSVNVLSSFRTWFPRGTPGRVFSRPEKSQKAGDLPGMWFLSTVCDFGRYVISVGTVCVDITVQWPKNGCAFFDYGTKVTIAKSVRNEYI